MSRRAPSQPPTERLLPILATLTDKDLGEWRAQLRDGGLTEPGIFEWIDAFPWQGVARWKTTDRQEAVELLTTADLLPQAWIGDTTRAWCCGLCDGRGWIPYLAGSRSEVCTICDEGGLDRPISIPALIQRTLYTPETLLRFEELARATATLLEAHGLPRAPRRILWKLGRREDYGKNVPVAWTGPQGHRVTLFDCYDVRGVWWPGGSGDKQDLPPGAELWHLGASLDAIRAKVSDPPGASRQDLVVAFRPYAAPDRGLRRTRDPSREWG
jgi:hypothetical protein